jgi:hypothetical protein
MAHSCVDAVAGTPAQHQVGDGWRNYFRFADRKGGCPGCQLHLRSSIQRGPPQPQAGSFPRRLSAPRQIHFPDPQRRASPSHRQSDARAPMPRFRSARDLSDQVQRRKQLCPCLRLARNERRYRLCISSVKILQKSVAVAYWITVSSTFCSCANLFSSFVRWVVHQAHCFA